MKRALYHLATRKAIARASHRAGKFMILETERLSLRPLETADAEFLFPILSDPEVMANWDVPEIDDPDLVRAIVEGQVADAAAGRSVHWTMWTLDDGEPVDAGDVIAEVMVAKATIEIEAPAAGVLRHVAQVEAVVDPAGLIRFIDQN